VANFRAAKNELGKFSEFVAHDLVVPPVSTGLQLEEPENPETAGAG
jgi:hypothetical protein